MFVLEFVIKIAWLAFLTLLSMSWNSPIDRNFVIMGVVVLSLAIVISSDLDNEFDLNTKKSKKIYLLLKIINTVYHIHGLGLIISVM